MAEVLVIGKKISEMDLVNDITGEEKIPTSALGDKAVTTGQLVEYLNNNSVARWGRIGGDINDQTDLQNQFSQERDALKSYTQEQVSQQQVALQEHIDATNEVFEYIRENGSALPYKEGTSYEEDAVVVKDGMLQHLKGGVWKSVIADGLSDTVQTFNTPEAGVDPVTGVAEGDYFNVRSSSRDSYVDEYQNIGGVPTPTGKSYPSGEALADVKDAIIDPATGKPSTTKVFLSNGVNLDVFLGQWVDITNLLIANDATASSWNSTVLNNAIIKAKAENKGIMCAPKGTVYAEGDLDFKFIQYIKFYSDIRNSTGTVIVGGFSNTANPVDITFQRITNGTSAINGAIPSIDVFRIEGVKAGVVNIGQTNLLRVHAVGGSSTQGSNAYFSINLGGSVRAFRVSDEGVDGWNNEFVVSGGRIIDLDVTGTGYTPNNIIFDNNVFEGTLVKIRFKNAWTNRITNARFENTGSSVGVIFEADTMQNTVIQRWNGSGSPRGMFEFSPPVLDLGKGNQCTTQSAVEFNNIELFSVSANSGIVSNGSSSACLDARIGRTKAGLVSKNVLQPTLTGFTAQGSRLIALSDVVEVQNGDAIKFDCDYGGNLIRPLVYVFDQNMRAITDAASDEVLLAGSAFSAVSAAFETTADRSATTLRNGLSINSDRIKYIQVGCYSSSGGFFRHLSATLFTQKLLRNKAISELSASQVIPNIAGKPTAGFVSVGTKLFDTTVRELISCTDALDTYITAATNSSTVNVSRNTGLKVGAIVGVIQVDGTTGWALINSISGNDVTLSKSVNVSAGARFVANSWAYDKPVNSVSYDPPSIAAGGNVTTTVTLTGVSTANNVSAAFSQYHPDIEIIAVVSSADTVTVKFKNVGASAVDLASGTLTVKMI